MDDQSITARRFTVYMPLSVDELAAYPSTMNSAVHNGLSDLARQVEQAVLALPVGHRLCLHPVESMTDSSDWHDDVTTIKFRRKWHTLGPDDSCTAPVREELTRR